MTKGVIVNIRPPNYRQRFQEAFSCVGWRIIEAPVLVPETLGATLPDPDAYDAIIFTSQVALELFRNTPAWHGKIAYAVGAATADAAHQAGFARAIQTGMDAKDLAKVLAAASFR
jgi:uroporphyrinogen-III synthase